MGQANRKSVARICLAVYCLLLLLSVFLLSVPEDMFFYWLLAALIALLPALWGERLYKLLAVAGLALSLVLLGYSLHAMQEKHEREQAFAIQRNLSSVEDEQATIRFSGEVNHGDTFTRAFGNQFVFVLQPIEHGWEIQIRDERGKENIARLTPPLKFGINPRFIEGWHLSNSDNTGSNESGEKNVNAPQDVRAFIFSPEVGQSIQGPDATQGPTSDEINRIEEFGKGWLTIKEKKLSNLTERSRASMAWMKFEVELTFAEKQSVNQ